MRLFPHQETLKNSIYRQWDAGASNVLAVAPTGSGKTVLFSKIIHEHRGAVCAVAHRQELVGQISLALAREEIQHRIIGPTKIIKFICELHQTELGRTFYDPCALVGVAGVDTLIRRGPQLQRWLAQVSLWVQDEAHHVLSGNKWGKAADMFPNAVGLGVTATPLRADGKGLGVHADGVFDAMCLGPTLGDLIMGGYLTSYRIFAPPSDLDLDGVKITGTGEFSQKELAQRSKKSHIVGDVVKHYLKLSAGKLGVTFTVSIESAEEIAAAYNAAGVPAAAVSSQTADADRVSLLRRFKNRELLQLVNCDLFGEGFDLPAIEVVSMARPTASYGLFVQQFGRALRFMEGKEFAIIIDHVGNVLRHGLPDNGKPWTLDRREKRGKNKNNDELPLKNCLECFTVYEAFRIGCPNCGTIPTPAVRAAPQFVDGDLVELDAAALDELRGKIARVDGPVYVPGNASPLAAAGIKKNHKLRQEAQGYLRNAVQWWAGVQVALGHTVREATKIFYFTFGVDVLTAQALGRPDAESLSRRIWDSIEALVNEHELTGVEPCVN